MHRRIAIARIYPELEHGKDKDYYVLNRQSDGSETILWMNENPQPTEEEMQVAYDAAMADKRNDIIKVDLIEIDMKSIRSIREWLVTQPDAPQYLLDYEAEAIEERKKIK